MLDNFTLIICIYSTNLLLMYKSLKQLSELQKLLKHNEHIGCQLSLVEQLRADESGLDGQLQLLCQLAV